MRRSTPTVGLIVEGETEYKALPQLHTLVPGCPPLKPINLRGIGSDRTPVGIARKVAPQVDVHIQAGRTKVLVCIDREQRPDCPGQLARAVMQALLTELKQRGYANPDVYVVVADRAFEAWLLADARGLHARRVFKMAPSFHCFEGAMGASDKKGVVEIGKLLGRSYDKVRDGPTIFAKIEFTEARKWEGGGHGSKSLDKFLDTLGVRRKPGG